MTRKNDQKVHHSFLMLEWAHYEMCCLHDVNSSEGSLQSQEIFQTCLKTARWNLKQKFYKIPKLKFLIYLVTRF